MPTPEEIKFDQSLKQLMLLHLAGMDPEQQKQLEATTLQIQQEYKEARAKADDKALSKETRDRYTKIAESVAKNLPGITKGTISAAEAFKKGDTISGAAAIMDICASVIPIFGSIAGPEGAAAGAVVGAIFSCVGQILACFAPKQPSLGDQIKKMFEAIEAEQELSNLAGVHSAINVYAAQLDKTREGLRKILAMPLNTEDDANQFRTHVAALEIAVIDQQGQINAAAFENWKVGGWLTRKENQAKERWPEVLGAWCQEYVHLLIANMRVNCLANPEEIVRLEALTSENNTASPLSKSTRKLVHTAVVERLSPILKFLRNKFTTWNNEALRIVRATLPAAEARGVCVHMAPWSGYGDILYVAVGREGPLDWVYKKNTGWIESFSIHVRGEELSSLTPRYEILALERSGIITRYSLDSVTGALSDGQQVMAGDKQYTNKPGGESVKFEHCVAVWGLPDWEDPTKTRIYTGHRVSGLNYVDIHVVDANNNVSRINWRPPLAGNLAHIRAVVRDITNSLPDDPDVAKMQSRPYEIIYGGYTGNPNIWVESDNDWRNVPSPWEQYNGIEVDPYCLWVFGTKGLACATHASLIRCQKEEIPKPKWITYAKGPADGVDVKTLSPCADGTLMIIGQTHEGNCWTARYSIDLKKESITFSRWVPRGGFGKQVKKMAIPCWSLLESLKANLQSDELSRGAGA